mmetsp:Transcript_53364/g.170979  ORF Transcript_53364/g.170979 Transcript_53364/m.170979 type:complete len:253 (+) Transcript_53364:880-1638(+)
MPRCNRPSHQHSTCSPRRPHRSAPERATPSSPGTPGARRCCKRPPAFACPGRRWTSSGTTPPASTGSLRPRGKRAPSAVAGPCKQTHPCHQRKAPAATACRCRMRCCKRSSGRAATCNPQGCDNAGWCVAGGCARGSSRVAHFGTALSAGEHRRHRCCCTPPKALLSTCSRGCACMGSRRVASRAGRHIPCPSCRSPGAPSRPGRKKCRTCPKDPSATRNLAVPCKSSCPAAGLGGSCNRLPSRSCKRPAAC